MCPLLSQNLYLLIHTVEMTFAQDKAQYSREELRQYRECFESSKMLQSAKSELFMLRIYEGLGGGVPNQWFSKCAPQFSTFGTTGEIDSSYCI